MTVLKTYQVLDSAKALGKLYTETRVPLKYKTRIIHLVKRHNEVATAFQEAQLQLQNQITERFPDVEDEKAMQDIVAKRQAAFTDEIKPALDEEVTIEFKPIPIAELESRGIELSAAEIEQLEWLFEFPAE